MFYQLLMNINFLNVSLSCENEFLEIDKFRSLQIYIKIYFMLQNDMKTCIYDSPTCKWISDEKKMFIKLFLVSPNT
jgi:hypothetical protein